MNEQSLAAFLHAQVACALIEMESMRAENECRGARGAAPAYDEKAFMDLIEKYGLHHNAAVATLTPAF